MSKSDDRLNQFIETNPKQTLQMVVFALCFIWMSGVAILGLILYLILSRTKYSSWIIPTLGVSLAVLSIVMSKYIDNVPLQTYLLQGFTINKIFWQLLFMKRDFTPLFFLYHNAGTYLLNFPLLVAGIFSMIDLLIKGNPHKAIIDAIQRGEHHQEQKELPEKKINKALQKLDQDNLRDGVLLGVSSFSAKPVIIPDHSVNQIVLVLGTTGSGKTITLRRFYQRAIQNGYPLIIVDGKPTQDDINWIKNLANKHNRKFYGFNCENYTHYDSLSTGDASELKDKIISLKDQWDSDYYRSIAEDYLQTTFEVLLTSGAPFDLKKVAKCLNFDSLMELCRSLKNKELLERVQSLQKYDLKDITGLRAHLNILVNSSFGEYFEQNDDTFSLKQIISNNEIVYFALPALAYPSFSKVLGKFVINDIKATIERNDGKKPIFMIFDEFSVFAGEQVLNLVNMGRGKGVHAVFGTQGVADMARVSPNFESQMLNCANTIISHRLNDHNSAETVAGWMGTKDTFTVTAQYDAKNSAASLGSVRPDKTYIVHPEWIKQNLRTGEAFYVSKVGGFSWDKVKVLWS